MVRLAALALCLLASIAFPVTAQTPLTIGFRSPGGRLETQPGAAWKTAIVISNKGTLPMRLTPRVQLPTGWRSLLPLEPFEVPPGQTNLFVVNAVVPQTAIAGSYPIYIDLESHRGERRRDTVTLSVLPRRSIRIAGAAGPRYARLDTTVTVDFIVRNDGNVRMPVNLRARAVDASAEVRDSVSLSLSPGDIRYVAVVVGDSRSARMQLVELFARTPGVGEYSGTFEVLRVAEATTTRTVVPLHVRLRAHESELTPSEITGGMIGRRDTFDLLLRRPGSIGTIVGERDEYRARWSGARGRLIAGDMVPNDGGPVRDSYEMLTGFDAALRLGKLTASGYAGRNRLLTTGDGEAGASLAVRAFRTLSVGAGALQRTGADSGDGRAWRAFTSLGENRYGLPILSAEFSQGQSGSSAYGMRAHQRFARGWFDVSSSSVGANYPARERGSSRTSLGFGGRVTRLLSFRGWAGEYQMDTLTLRDFGFQSKSYSAGLTFGPITADYRIEERDAIIAGFEYAARDESARATIGHGFGRATLSAGAEVGKSFDAANLDGVTPFQRFSGSAYVSGSARWMGGFSVEHYSRRGLSRNQQFSGTVTGSARLFSGTRVELTGSLFHVLFPRVESYSTVNARIEQALRGGQTVALRARTFATSASTDLPLKEQTTFFLEYGLPLRIPLPGIGPRQIRARVVDAGSGNGVPGALVRMGEYTAITNREGRVVFAPSAVLNAISVERPGATAPLVVDASELTAAGNRRRDVTIPVGEGARVMGRVTRYDRITRDSVAPAGGIANVLVTLSRGPDTVNVMTESDGAYDVKQLAPGTWKVSVAGGQIPPSYGFERSTASVAVAAGRTASLDFRVLSRASEARLDDGGSLSLPSPQASPKPTPPKP